MTSILQDTSAYIQNNNEQEQSSKENILNLERLINSSRNTYKDELAIINEEIHRTRRVFDQARETTLPVEINLKHSIEIKIRDLVKNRDDLTWLHNEKEAFRKNEIERLENVARMHERYPIIDPKLFIDDSKMVDFIIRDTQGKDTAIVGLPRLGVFSIDHPYFSMVHFFDPMSFTWRPFLQQKYTPSNLSSNFDFIPLHSTLREAYDIRKLTFKVPSSEKYLSNAMVDASYVPGNKFIAEFPGFIPQRVKDQIQRIGHEFDQLYFICELEESNWRYSIEIRPEPIIYHPKSQDPLLIGVKYNTLWLIADFDTTTFEEELIANNILFPEQIS